jgi:hypothetical protein
VAQKVACGICSIHIKTIRVAAVDGYKTDVVEHRPCVEKFSVELEATALTGERGEIIDEARVVEQQSRFRIADELRDCRWRVYCREF